MILLGIILAIVGAFTRLQLLITLGVVLIVIGLVLWLAGGHTYY